MVQARAALLALGACLLAQPTRSHGVSIDGSGTTNPSTYFWKIMALFEARTKSDISLTYRAVGSSAGQAEFSQIASGDYSGQLNDFGSGDIPMTKTMYDGIVAAGREMVHVPFCLGAVGIFHSVPADEIGNEGLRLSPCVLAKIFSGQITTWDDAAIKADNPEIYVPAGTKIQVGRRNSGSSSTSGTTGYLTAKCPADWKMVDTGTAMGNGASITWPSLDNFFAVEGSAGMVAHILKSPYAIGYLDAGHGHIINMPEAELMNEDNKWLTSKQAIAAVDSNGNNGVAAAGKAVMDAGSLPAVTEDWSAVDLYRKAGPNTWPIVLVSYIYVSKDWSSLSADTAGLLRAFIDFVTSREAFRGQAILPEFSFNEVPVAMNRWVETWDSVITKPASVTEYTFEAAATAWTGQGMNVISERRSSYSVWKEDQLDSSMNMVMQRLTTLETALDEYGIVPLHGSGTTNPKNWFAKAMNLMEERSRAPLLLTYRAVGSTTGQEEFVGNAGNDFMSYNHFAAGDLPMTSVRYNLLMAMTPPAIMLHLPVALGAIGVFHQIPQSELGGMELKLDACLLASIFSGTITTWDHAEILAANPGMSVPAGTTIQVGHRVLGSSSTGGLAGYLNQKCPAKWPLGDGSTLNWATSSGFNPVDGSPGMQNHIKDKVYSIGYLDAGQGHDFHLPEVAVANADGASRTSKASIALGGVTEAGIRGLLAMRFPSSPTADWSSVNLYDMPGANTWPIVLVTYLYVKKDQTKTNPKTAAALRAFIQYIATNMDGLCQEFGFTEPASSLRNKTLAAAASIVYPAGMDMFTFETATTMYTGMGVGVISSLRGSIDMYERGVLKAEIQAVQEWQARAELAGGDTPSTPSTPSPSKASTPAPAPASVDTSSDDNGEDSKGIAIAAIVVAIVAILISAASTVVGFMALKEAKASKSGPTENLQGGQVYGQTL